MHVFFVLPSSHLLSVQEKGCWALLHLTLDNGPNILRAVAANAIEHVVSSLSSHRGDPFVQHRACEALWSLTEASLTHRQRAVDLGAIDCLVATITRHPTVVSVQENACGLLSCLTADSEARRQRAAAVGAAAALQATIATFTNDDHVQHVALVALSGIDSKAASFHWGDVDGPEESADTRRGPLESKLDGDLFWREYMGVAGVDGLSCFAKKQTKLATDKVEFTIKLDLIQLIQQHIDEPDIFIIRRSNGPDVWLRAPHYQSARDWVEFLWRLVGPMAATMLDTSAGLPALVAVLRSFPSDMSVLHAAARTILAAAKAVQGRGETARRGGGCAEKRTGVRVRRLYGRG